MATVIQVVVTGAYVELYSATLHLDAAQADARRTRLEPVKVRKDGGGVYTISRPPVQFKHGERFGLEDGIPKDQVHALADVAELAAREAAERERQLELEIEADEKARRDIEDRAAKARADQQHAALVDAFVGVPGDPDGTVDRKALDQAISAAKLDFAPHAGQIEDAWRAVVEGARSVGRGGDGTH